MPEQSTNQMHGKSFENMIKAANGIFTLAAADRPRSPNQMFDIDDDDDHAFGFATAVKTTKTGTIGLLMLGGSGVCLT